MPRPPSTEFRAQSGRALPSYGFHWDPDTGWTDRVFREGYDDREHGWEESLTKVLTWAIMLHDGVAEEYVDARREEDLRNYPEIDPLLMMFDALLHESAETFLALAGE
jgi:putative NADPH-quinone reductase